MRTQPVIQTNSISCRRVSGYFIFCFALWAFACGCVTLDAAATTNKFAPVRQYTYTVVQSYPHSIQDFTQGLVYADGKLYESTGLYGRSALSIKSLETSRTIHRIQLPARYFAEGLTLVNDELVQLTYRERTGFVYAKTSLAIVRTFEYKGEGWGLAYNGKDLIMSDGSARLYFLDPATYRSRRTLDVTRAGIPVQHLNELEYIEGKIYANVWQQNIIVLIDPVNGQVDAEIDLSALAAMHDKDPIEGVLNGIAWIPERNTMLVTGKAWSKLYEIKLQE